MDLTWQLGKFYHEESYSPQTLTIVMHIKTVILPGNFSFGLITFVNFPTTFIIQRF